VPRRHVTSLLDLSPGDDGLAGTLVRTGRDLAQLLGIARDGFRLVFNCGEDAGYSVQHIHLHLLGGRRLGWPPG
jgi:histidine triad (HIT) family protein